MCRSTHRWTSRTIVLTEKIRLNHPAFKMKEGARKGRTFSNIVSESGRIRPDLDSCRQQPYPPSIRVAPPKLGGETDRLDTRGPHLNNEDVWLSSGGPVNIHHTVQDSTSLPVRCRSFERTTPPYIESMRQRNYRVDRGGSLD